MNLDTETLNQCVISVKDINGNGTHENLHKRGEKNLTHAVDL